MFAAFALPLLLQPFLSIRGKNEQGRYKYEMDCIPRMRRVVLLLWYRKNARIMPYQSFFLSPKFSSTSLVLRPSPL